jgi:hypothetical protein
MSVMTETSLAYAPMPLALRILPGVWGGAAVLPALTVITGSGTCGSRVDEVEVPTVVVPPP